MDNLAFTTVQYNIKNLPYIELKRLKHNVDEQISKDRVGQTIAERENKISISPHCEGKTFCDGE